MTRLERIVQNRLDREDAEYRAGKTVAELIAPVSGNHCVNGTRNEDIGAGYALSPTALTRRVDDIRRKRAKRDGRRGGKWA